MRNLPFHVSEDDLSALFGPFGLISEVHVPMDAESRRGKGFGYVEFAIGEHAVRALAALDGQFFQARDPRPASAPHLWPLHCWGCPTAAPPPR